MDRRKKLRKPCEELIKQYDRMFSKAISAHVGPGWVPLVETFCEGFEKIDPDGRIVQLKEKFGGLRIYFETSDPSVSKIVGLLMRGAESSAWNTCENCGTQHGVETKGGWRKTLCESCRSEWQKTS